MNPRKSKPMKAGRNEFLLKILIRGDISNLAHQRYKRGIPKT
jgi:hypothetical protein